MSSAVNVGSWSIRRGDAAIGDNAFVIQDFEEDGVTPSDLTAFGDTWTAQARTAPDTDPAIDITVDSSTPGQLTLTIPDASVTAGMTAEQYLFDVQATAGGDATTAATPYEGTIKVKKDITHA